MTEHTKIPLPEGAQGKSLFERAEGSFGSFDGFKAAPVPADLAPPANRRWKKPEGKRQPSQELLLPVPPTEPASVSATPAAHRIKFTGEPRRLDRARLERQALIVPGGRVTALAEEFRIVKRQILLTAREVRIEGAQTAQRVLVCSPLSGEGKTFCATNLALSIAGEKDTEVVLVDADFGKPSILSLLGLSVNDHKRGLMDALADPEVRVEDCVIATDVPGLYVLPAGNRTDSDSEYLTSAHTSTVLDRLTAGAPNRIVIFDSPPALAASPAAELAKHCGQALMICLADKTGQSALEDALSLLSSCPDIKLLLNAANFSPSGRRFGDYYGHGG